VVACGVVLLLGRLDCWFCCCSGRNRSEYPWNGNNSSGDKSCISHDLAPQTTDVNILERNSSNYDLKRRQWVEFPAASGATGKLKKA
jgi:hypothetical protein